MNLKNSNEASLLSGIQQLDLEISATQSSMLLDYVELLLKWNKVYNLTAVRDPLQMVTRHLLDSLAIGPWCTEKHYIDVGTGAGLPGVPLAILYPEQQFDLLDSNSKKTRFLFQVKTALGLNNVSVHHSRVETFTPTQRYDAVLSRAFASLVDIVEGCRGLLRNSGQFLAMKGVLQESELKAVEALGYTADVHKLDVPRLDEQRHLIILSGK